MLKATLQQSDVSSTGNSLRRSSEITLLQSQRQSSGKCTLGRNIALASVGYQKAGSPSHAREIIQPVAGGNLLPTEIQTSVWAHILQVEIRTHCSGWCSLPQCWTLTGCSAHAALSKSGLPPSIELSFFPSKFNQEFSRILNSLHVSLISSSDSYFLKGIFLKAVRFEDERRRRENSINIISSVSIFLECLSKAISGIREVI